MQLIAWATEIRMRAVRQIGLMMQARRAAGLMAKGGDQYHKSTGSVPSLFVLE